MVVTDAGATATTSEGATAIVVPTGGAATGAGTVAMAGCVVGLVLTKTGVGSGAGFVAVGVGIGLAIAKTDADSGVVVVGAGLAGAGTGLVASTGVGFGTAGVRTGLAGVPTELVVADVEVGCATTATEIGSFVISVGVAGRSKAVVTVVETGMANGLVAANAESFLAISEANELRSGPVALANKVSFWAKTALAESAVAENANGTGLVRGAATIFTNRHRLVSITTSCTFRPRRVGFCAHTVGPIRSKLNKQNRHFIGGIVGGM